MKFTTRAATTNATTKGKKATAITATEEATKGIRNEDIKSKLELLQ